MEEKSIIKTDDGSHSIFSKQFNSTYHSTHGAIQESKHVFIKNGIKYYNESNNREIINILEYGFGTGLNALLALEYAEKYNIKVNYTALEAYPIDLKTIEDLNYIEELKLNKFKNVFYSFHQDKASDLKQYSDYFGFEKKIVDFNNFIPNTRFDIIFFDVFGAETQPELWLRPFLDSVYKLMSNNSILITYGAKGSFKRALKSLELKIENPEGPPGKREITRAIRKI